MPIACEAAYAAEGEGGGSVSCENHALPIHWWLLSESSFSASSHLRGCNICMLTGEVFLHPSTYSCSTWLWTGPVFLFRDTPCADGRPLTAYNKEVVCSLPRQDRSFGSCNTAVYASTFTIMRWVS
jgi:hypothetical protein